MKRARLPVYLAVSALAAARTAAGAPERDAYGTTDVTMVQVAATQCAPINGTVAATGVDGFVYPSAGAGNFDCWLDLPTGARLVKFAVISYDASDTFQLTATLIVCDALQAPGFSCSGTTFAHSAGTASAPQVARISSDLSAQNLIVDKTARTYFVRALLPSTAGDIQFRVAEVYYKLQVSTPSPGTQTFGDVPASHPYYKAIEALAASGITGGCGNGNFCPNQNVTRGEMAAFFSRALGLHFPN